MTRSTSIAAYNTIKENGMLSKRRLEVYDVVFRHGPMTSGEAFRILNQKNPVKNLTQSRARFTELRDMGVFSEVGKRPCSVSGAMAIVWDVTSKLPIPIKKEVRHKCTQCDGKGFLTDGDLL